LSFDLITNAHVFSPEDMGLNHLLIAGGQIVWIGKDLPGLRGLPLETTDLEGQRLIPGIIDGHAHLTGGGGESGFKSRVPPVQLSQFTSAGITSVVGVLGTDDTTRDTRALLAQTRALREEGLNAWCHTGGYHIPPVTFSENVRDDIVHIDPIIGVGEVAISDHRSSQPTLAEFLRLASDAHVSGLITGKAGILHLHLGDGKRGLELVRNALDQTELPGRIFNPTHINRRKGLFDEALNIADRGCTIDITAFPVEDNEDAWAADVALMKYLDTDSPSGNITVSSDGGGCLPKFNCQGELIHMDIGNPSSLIETIQILLSRGVPLEQILPAFTSNVARILRFHDKGRIACGMSADLIVLDDNNKIRDVMLSGIWHVKQYHQSIRGYFEAVAR
jgi:beta-aspartyl-dipeptidase (metallo-type)